MSSTSPNMNLTISTIAVDSGLAWEQNLNASLTLIDAHTHASGSGIQIQPNGLNINTDLTFNSNQATNLKSILFTNQTSLATLNALYTVAGELWYNDAAGAVQITSAGTVNATSSGISSGTASASFSAGVLVVLAAAVTPANIQAASLLIGNNVANSKYLTLSPPNAMAANYTLVLPSIPASSLFVTLDTSGNFGTANNIQGTQIAAASLTGAQLAGLTITGANIAAATITGAKLVAQTITATQVANATLTGTQMANNVNFPGKTVQESSQNVVVSNTNSNTNSLAVIRTQFNSGGAAAIGEGASGVNNSPGVYTITWTTAFGDTPVIVATLQGNPGQIITTAIGTTACTVGTWDITGVTPTNAPFSIIAIGSRA